MFEGIMIVLGVVGTIVGIVAGTLSICHAIRQFVNERKEKLKGKG